MHRRWVRVKQHWGTLGGEGESGPALCYYKKKTDRTPSKVILLACLSATGPQVDPQSSQTWMQACSEFCWTLGPEIQGLWCVSINPSSPGSSVR